MLATITTSKSNDNKSSKRIDPFSKDDYVNRHATYGLPLDSVKSCRWVIPQDFLARMDETVMACSCNQPDEACLLKLFRAGRFSTTINSGLYDDGHAYVSTSTTPPMIIVKVVIIANHYLDDAVQPQHHEHLGRARAALSSITRGLRAEFYKSSGRLSSHPEKAQHLKKCSLKKIVPFY